MQTTDVTKIHGTLFTVPIGWEFSSALFARRGLDLLLPISFDRVDHAYNGEIRGEGGGSGGGRSSLEHGLAATLGANDGRRRSFGERDDTLQTESVGVGKRMMMTAKVCILMFF